MTNDSLIGKLDAKQSEIRELYGVDGVAAFQEAINIVRQHEAAPDVKKLGDILYDAFEQVADRDGYVEPEDRITIARAAIKAMGEGSATIAPLQAETIEPVTPASDCGHCIRYGSSGCPDHKPSEIPDNESVIKEILTNALYVKHPLASEAERVDHAYFKLRPYLCTTEPEFHEIPESIPAPIAAAAKAIQACTCGDYGLKTAMRAIEAYEASRKPVSVSLEKCAEAVKRTHDFTGYNVDRAVAKAILESLKAQGVEVVYE